MRQRNSLLGWAGIAALLALGACNHDEPETPDLNEGHDDAYWAGLASISSNDSSFTAASDGGTIAFDAAGGEVVVNVDCGTEWIAANPATDLFTTVVDLNAGTLTITAGQNAVAEERTATVVLLTAAKRVSFATLTLTQTAYGAPEISVGTTVWHAPALGELSTEISVESSLGTWTVGNESDWLTVESTGTGITLTAAENFVTEARTSDVILTASDGIGSASATITVTQDARAFISLTQDALELYDAGESGKVTVKTNYDWDYSYDSSNGWFTIGRDGDSLIATITADNEGDDRSAIVNVYAGDGAANTAEAQFTVTQNGSDPDALIFGYTIADAGTTVRLPLAGTVSCSVAWGDGSPAEAVTSTLPSHSYASAGEYKVRVSGTVTALDSENISSSRSPASSLTAIHQWGKTGLTSLYSAFYYCTGLTALPEDTDGSFSEVTTFEWAFGDCTSLKSVPVGLFTNCSKVTTYADLFYECGSLEALPEGLFDNSTAVTSFAQAFYKCTALASIPETLFANCAEVTSFSEVFECCESLPSVPAALFANNPKNTTFKAAFYKCAALKEVPSTLFSNCPLVETYHNVFSNTGLTKLPAGLFDSATKATDFYGVCYNCTALTTIEAGVFDKCAAATEYDYAFYGCTALESVPDGLFAGSPDVTNFRQCFWGCTGLKSVPTSLFSNNRKVVNFISTFYGCTGLTGESPYDELSVEGETEPVKVHLYERTNYPDIYTKPTSTANCFNGCAGLSDYTTIPSSWGGGN